MLAKSKRALFNKGIEKIEWPARSQDLNKIVNIWKIVIKKA